MTENRESPVSPRDAWRVLMRHKKKSLAFFVGTMAAVCLAIIVWPRSYSSEAKLFVRVGRESVTLDPTATTGETITLDKSHEHEINSVMEIMGSRGMAERVVDVIGVDAILTQSDESSEPPTRLEFFKDRAQQWLRGSLEQARLASPVSQREAAIQRVVKSTNVWAPKQSAVISVEASARSPRLAQHIVEATTDVFLQEHLRLNRTEGSHEFFAKQSALLLDQLTKVNSELRDRKNEFGLLTIEGKRKILDEQVSEIRNQLLDTERALIFSETKARELKTAIDALAPEIVTQQVSGIGNLARDRMRERLYGLEIRENELLSVYTLDHPLAQAVREQRGIVAEILKREPSDRTEATTGPNPAHRTLTLELTSDRADAVAYRSRYELLVQQETRLQEECTALNEQEFRIAQLARRSATLEQNYLKHMDKLEQARINKALETQRISNVNVAQAATFVEKPDLPKPRLMLIVGLIVATGGSLAVAFFAEHLDQTLRTPEQVETHVELPVLASIPRTAQRHAVLH